MRRCEFTLFTHVRQSLCEGMTRREVKRDRSTMIIFLYAAARSRFTCWACPAAARLNSWSWLNRVSKEMSHCSRSCGSEWEDSTLLPLPLPLAPAARRCAVVAFAGEAESVRVG